MLKQLQSFLLPITVAILVPLLILTSTNSTNIGWGLPSPLNLLPIIIGLLLIAAGLSLVFMTISWFITLGKGTLAPWTPTQHLVVVGVYRYVRNPMISGVGAIILGETLFFGSTSLLIWVLFFVVLNAVYIPLSEEPGLRERFGAEYDEYTRNVPRWLPRRTPWTST